MVDAVTEEQKALKAAARDGFLAAVLYRVILLLVSERALL